MSWDRGQRIGALSCIQVYMLVTSQSSGRLVSVFSVPVSHFLLRCPLSVDKGHLQGEPLSTEGAGSNHLGPSDRVNMEQHSGSGPPRPTAIMGRSYDLKGTPWTETGVVLCGSVWIP